MRLGPQKGNRCAGVKLVASFLSRCGGKGVPRLGRWVWEGAIGADLFVDGGIHHWVSHQHKEEH